MTEWKDRYLSQETVLRVQARTVIHNEAVLTLQRANNTEVPDRYQVRFTLPDETEGRGGWIVDWTEATDDRKGWAAFYYDKKRPASVEVGEYIGSAATARSAVNLLHTEWLKRHGVHKGQ